MARAGRLVSRHTLGSFASLRDEINDDGKPVLLADLAHQTQVILFADHKRVIELSEELEASSRRCTHALS